MRDSESLPADMGLVLMHDLSSYLNQMSYRVGLPVDLLEHLH